MKQETTLATLERLTLDRTAVLGKHASCGVGCRMTGKKCPAIWCEVHYQEIRKELAK